MGDVSGSDGDGDGGGGGGVLLRGPRARVPENK